MGNDKMRDEFERAVQRDWPSASLLRVNQVGAPTNGFYRDDRVQHAWWGWLSSRASLVVDLPSEYDCCGGTTSYEIREMAIEAVEAAGLQVTP
ncbi:hypothetical protein [Pseudomonas coleopterorum]|uniref:hypothetical protein n=1 Tax=Pseudomonas coleopterorum TaxID=1605838 RepID=UPI000897756E|nr:hypothetical protein [Pseudomonas coleopterorum]SEE13302.1 hypothetical protein SAMN05216510_1563 [Pseudomonas coleopterorum]